jgi:SAM-dependent methyltransferase
LHDNISEGRLIPGLTGASIAAAWNEASSALWLKRVGPHGDLLQQTLVKPFVLASMLLTDESARWQLPESFYDLVCYIMGLDPAALRTPEAWRMAIKDAKLPQEASSLLDGFLIVDLGCGNGYLSWLTHFGARYVGVDSSALLIDRAARSQPRARRYYAKHDLSAQPVDLMSLVRSKLNGALAEIKTVVVTCLDVLDHIADPAPLLSSIREFCDSIREHCDYIRKSGDAETHVVVIASTLNPSFCFDRKPVDLPVERQWSVYRWPSGEHKTAAYPANWQTYNRLFSQHGLMVHFVANVDLDHLHPAYATPIRSHLVHKEWPQAGGPLVLWTLEPIPKAHPVSAQELEQFLSANATLAVLAEESKDAIRANVASLQRRLFPPGFLATAPGDICRGLSFVTRGHFNMIAGGTVTQRFGEGTIFGDLESIERFYAGRYLYPLAASKRPIVDGRYGGECLEIPTAVLPQVLGPLSLSRLLYTRMRDRLDAYIPFYHRSAGFRLSGFGRDVANHKIFTGSDKTGSDKVVPRDFENLIRALVTLICQQEDKFQNDPDFPILSLLVKPTELRRWIAAKNAGAKGISFVNETRALHRLGIIDAYQMSNEYQSTDDVRRDFIDKRIETLLRAARRLLIAEPMRGGDPAGDEERARKIVPDDVIMRLARQQVVRNMDAAKISLTQEFEKELKESEWQCKDQKVDPLTAYTFYYNTAFMKWGMLKRDQYTFLVIRDYHFLRRVATGDANHWVKELVARASLRSDRRDGSPNRFLAYMAHWEAYAKGHWQRGYDLDYSGPQESRAIGLWRRLIDAPQEKPAAGKSSDRG